MQAPWLVHAWALRNQQGLINTYCGRPSHTLDKECEQALTPVTMLSIAQILKGEWAGDWSDVNCVLCRQALRQAAKAAMP